MVARVPDQALEQLLLIVQKARGRQPLGLGERRQIAGKRLRHLAIGGLEAGVMGLR
jgi:hypothetical protein